MDLFQEWLEKYGLEKYADTLADNDIRLDIVASLTEDDLKDLGLTLGDRKRFQAAVQQLSNDEFGSKDGQTVADVRPSSRDAEHRQLTVMFCDLVGSTGLSQKFDPEDLRDIIKACHAEWKLAVERYEGFVARYMGDGILVYFGYPSAHEDDPQRAVHAGLDIVDVMDGVDAKVGHGEDLKLQVRVGIATGSVVVGDLIGEGASQESPVLGETPNLAARLQGEANPGAVVISGATYHLVKRQFDCENLAEKTLKGIAKPVPAWRVTARVASISRFESRLSAHETPLVGRTTEVELLMDRWQQAKDGETQVVLLCGEAGIGKSKIAHVLMDRIARQPHMRLRYQCSPYHTNSALHPFIEQMKRAVLAEKENRDTGKLEALMAVLEKGEQDLEGVVPLFAELLSIPTEGRYPMPDMLPQRRKELTIEAILGQVRGLAQRDPLLFVMEDIHWIDPTTSEVVGRLLDEIQNSRVLILLTYRPEFSIPWQLRANMTTLTLNRMSRRQCVEIINGCTEGRSLPDDLLEQMIERTDGVPLFLEELTHTILESGLLIEESGGYVFKRKSLSTDIPETLKDSLLARLDRLGPAKEVAQVGAVVGREFAHDLLAAVSDIEPSRLQGYLDQLTGSGLIFRRGQPPNAMYTFKHALVRDTAYQCLLKKKRKALHRKIVSLIEESSPEIADSQPELLARHAMQADMMESAVRYWLRAGERDATRSSNVEAIVSLRNGLESLEGLPEGHEKDQLELKLLTALGPAQMATLGWDAPEVDETYSRARILAHRSNLPAALFPSIWGLWLVAHAGGKPAKAKEFLNELLEVAEAQNDRELLLQAYHAGGSHSLGGGALTDAQYYIDKGISLYAEGEHSEQALRYGGHDPCVCANSMGALTHFMQGNLATAERFSRKALELAKTIGHRPSVAHAYSYRAELSHLRGKPAEAREYAERVLEIAEPFGMNQYAAWATMMIGWSLAAEGNAGPALSQVESGLEKLRKVGIRYHLAHRIVLWAETLASAGLIAEAASAVKQALTVTKDTGEHWFEPEIIRLQARLLGCMEPANVEEANNLLKQAVVQAENMGAKLWQLRAATDLVCLTPEDEDARTALQSILDGFTEGFDAPELREAKHILTT